MSDLLTEFLSRLIKTEASKRKKPPVSTAKYSSGGKWYTAKDGEYVGRYVGDEWKDATPEEKAAEKAATTQTAPAAAATTVQPTPATAVEPTGTSQEKQATITSQMYGQDGKGDLLQGGSGLKKMMRSGWKKGKGAARGNAGSAFNEHMSNEGVKILELHPDLDEETLARVIFERTRRTKFGRQQKETSVASGQGLKVPDDIKKLNQQQQIIYKNCVIAARSARTKFARAQQDLEAVRNKGIFGTKVTHHPFGGTKEELSEAIGLVSKMPETAKIYTVDEEIGVVEIPKDILLDWMGRSGGGENAADTMILSTDESGNIIYAGWSDKKTLKDIQGNSTLNNEYSDMTGVVADLQTMGRLDENASVAALSDLQSAQVQSEEIEDGYADVSSRLANYFLDNTDEMVRYGTLAKEQQNTRAHYENFLQKIAKGGNARGQYKRVATESLVEAANKGIQNGAARAFYTLCRLGQERLLTADDRKILERSAATERRRIVSDNDGELPKEHMGLDVESSLQELRLSVIDLQRNIVKKLNRQFTKSNSGKEVRLGNYLKAREIIEMLHLDKIDNPSGPEDYVQLLRRNTHLVMEGIPITPARLRKCIGVNTTNEFEDNFEVVVDKKDKNVVYIYSVNKEGIRVLIAKKVYRSKTGLTGATGTTVEWTKQMQHCFDLHKKK